MQTRRILLSTLLAILLTPLGARAEDTPAPLPTPFEAPAVAADTAAVPLASPNLFLPLLLGGAAAATPAQPQPVSTYEDQVIALVNQERARAGCAALTVNTVLMSAAEAHSLDMATRGYFDHTNPEGLLPWDRARAAGYPSSSVGENIAAGYTTPDSVMLGWMKSNGHRRNIQNCSYREIGVGYVKVNGSQWGSYWTQMFGKP